MKYLCIKDFSSRGIKKSSAIGKDFIYFLSCDKGSIIDIGKDHSIISFVIIDNPEHFIPLIEHRKKVIKKLLSE